MTKSALKSKTPQSVGREYLKKRLMKQGHSRRQSVEILDAIFATMSAALARDEEVEFAYGKLVRARKRFGQWWDLADDWPAHRQGYTVEWEPSAEGRERMYGPLGKEERAYLEAVWQAPSPEKRNGRGRKKDSGYW